MPQGIVNKELSDNTTSPPPQSKSRKITRNRVDYKKMENTRKTAKVTLTNLAEWSQKLWRAQHQQPWAAEERERATLAHFHNASEAVSSFILAQPASTPAERAKTAAYTRKNFTIL